MGSAMKERRHNAFVACLVLAAAIYGCALAQRTLYNPALAPAVQTWYLGFTYETGSVSQTQKQSGAKEVTVTTAGRTARDLQLRDDVFFTLRDKYHVLVTRVADSANGAIRLNPVNFYRSGFKSVDIVLEGQPRP